MTTLPRSPTTENPADPAPAAKAPPPLTALGKLVTGLAVLILVAGVALAAFFGVPIPFTDYTLHHVGLSIVLGCIPALVFYKAAGAVCGVVGLRMERDPAADPFPPAHTVD